MKFLKEIIEDNKNIWFFPMVWPFVLMSEICIRTKRWQTFVITCVLSIPVLFIGIPLLIIPTIILWIFILFWAIISLPFAMLIGRNSDASL